MIATSYQLIILSGPIYQPSCEKVLCTSRKFSQCARHALPVFLVFGGHVSCALLSPARTLGPTILAERTPREYLRIREAYQLTFWVQVTRRHL